MHSETKARLRDRREPGHFWADNEILDVFGDELGQNGISVYMTLTRFCFGSEVRLSLREIAAAARMSKDTVARAMKVLVRLGLVIETKGARAKTVSTWSLTNVKALVQEYVHESVSRGDRSRTERKPPSPNPAGHSTLLQLLEQGVVDCRTVRQMVGVTADVENPAVFMGSGDKMSPESSAPPQAAANPATVNELQDVPGQVGKSGDKMSSEYRAREATDLSQNDPDFATDLSHQTVPLLYKTQDSKPQDKDKTPLPPSTARGERVANGADAATRNAAGELDEAVRKVMRECSLSDRRLGPAIAQAIAAHRARTDQPPGCNAVAERMIAARSEYLEFADVLKYQVGARKFFAHGLWLDERLWSFDRQRIRERRQASVGSQESSYTGG